MNKWKCIKCGKNYNIRSNIGKTNMITNETECIYCYNKTTSPTTLNCEVSRGKRIW